MGPPGPPGPQGPAGTNAGIQSGRWCGKIDGGWFFNYDVVTYATGDKFVSCSVETDFSTNSSATMWKAGQNGATDAACSVTADSDSTATGGWWRFSDEGGPRAVYSDSGSTLNGDVVTFTPSDCSVL
ncbi:MAG: hypothetical protein L0Y66_23615 [Myxococcaceae bacterium]|nr:hypothetical protein [Myxococcaceae bacterium]MCI0669414.1 hypothetical protein [Myxococcaceae bacterium]